MQTVTYNVFSGIHINSKVLETKSSEAKRGSWSPWCFIFLKEMIYLPDYYYTVRKVLCSNGDCITESQMNEFYFLILFFNLTCFRKVV